MEQLKNVAAIEVQVGRGFLIEKVSLLLQEIHHPNSRDTIVLHKGGFKYFPHDKPFRFFILNYGFLEMSSQAFCL